MVLPRIGVLIPSTNTAVEADFQRVLAGHASVHSERLFIPDGQMSEAHLDEMNRDLEARIRSLASAKVDVVAYACTSGSFYKGVAWDEAVIETVQRVAGVPCTTTSKAVVEALRCVAPSGAIAAITPYPEWTNQRLRQYYEAQGFSILALAGDERSARGGHRFVNDQDPAEIARFGLENMHEDARALFCSCTAWRAFEALPALEAALGIPVVTSNQATLWKASRMLNLQLPAQAGTSGPFGRLSHF
ncbi:maleate cis-trans isomerase [Alicycliphilus denitrificans]|uniref:maleate cis-trans isomerase family protein n=1 Tax=Alicycliphilus denitrificans TaxID=179636 RepID=UPI000964E514|nr:aspartate/glutamate racemase family protein [Alicycliphilus denitrificans]MBN9572439.1 aspartate/glutamate racemase family protein [Alicycliphilus denitrificans]OJW91540.1 MAG: Asp/Glu racemase [Alicycliphilus sp. 69-12]BCN37799.1 maleate cis-trans isomerase [Alicycliphilus denitrificans]